MKPIFPENQYLLYAEIKKVFETQMICLFNKTDLLEDDSVIEEYSQKIDDPIFKTSINDLSNISDIKNLIDNLLGLIFIFKYTHCLNDF